MKAEPWRADWGENKRTKEGKGEGGREGSLEHSWGPFGWGPWGRGSGVRRPHGQSQRFLHITS